MQEPLCSREEAEYLVDALDKGKAKKPQQEFSFTVWFAVLRQKVVWGMALTTVINGLGTPALLTYVPQYLVTQLGFDIKSMGWISGLPFYAAWLGTLVGGCKCSSSLLGFSKKRSLTKLPRRSGRLDAQRSRLEHGQGAAMVVHDPGRHQLRLPADALARHRRSQRWPCYLHAHHRELHRLLLWAVYQEPGEHDRLRTNSVLSLVLLTPMCCRTSLAATLPSRTAS